MDIRDYNRTAWNTEVEKGNEWTRPVTSDVIARARQGDWQLVLTPLKPVPASWFPALPGKDVLCLASGGGQQGPILAAAGARVTVLDNSDRQLEQDRMVARRDGLELTAVEGDMRDLSRWPDESFDLIFHPVSNIFIPDVMPVWREAFRVLRPGGTLLAGIVNPMIYIFDYQLAEAGTLVVRYSLPYSDLENMPASERQQYMDAKEPLEWSHTFEEQIGGQMTAGFHLIDMYEDSDPGSLISKFIPGFFATRALKPR